jgi:hypothetical protein
MYQTRFGVRSEYRQAEGLRVKESPTLAAAFSKLKSLSVDLAYFDTDGVTRTNHIKYDVNLANAKSVFRFNCVNGECVRGDFDLSADLAKAIAAKRKTVNGELICQGWRSKATIGRIRCHQILRYTLRLGY